MVDWPTAVSEAHPPATAVFTLRVRDVMAPPPPTTGADVPIGDALAKLIASRATALIVVDGHAMPIGIVTERDVARRVTFQASRETAIATVTTRPVQTVGEADHLYRAIARMRQAGFRHMPVVAANGTLAGTLDLDRALVAAASRTMRQIDRLTGETTPEGFRASRAAHAEIAAEMLADGLSARAVQGVIADHNRDIHRALLSHCLAQDGARPVGCTGLILGSGGRGESFLHPDQDNALILDDYPDDEHGRIDAWYVQLAERFTAALATAGFPLCAGNVMVSNPLWRKTRTQWRDQVSMWVRKRNPVAVLYADVFLDFVPFAGDPMWADALRRHVLDEIRFHPALLGEMALVHAENTVARGIFGGLPRRIDLKLRGLMPLVGAVRLLALRAGIAATPTLARIAALSDAGVLDRDTADEVTTAFDTLTDTVLRQQIAAAIGGRAVGNEIATHNLTRRERRALRDALDAGDRLQRRARADLTGQVL